MAIEKHGRRIRFRITRNGIKDRANWPKPYSKAEWAAAERVQSRIDRDVEDGLFTRLADYLPRQESDLSIKHFGPYAQTWFDNVCGADDKTRKDYKSAINSVWLPLIEDALGDRPIDAWLPSDVQGLVKKAKKLKADVTAKRRNDILSPFRQILQSAFRDRIMKDELHKYVVGERTDDPEPDPFRMEEADQIIEHFRGRHLETWWQFAFYSGLRTGEIVALEWGDVDFTEGTVMVTKTVSNYQERDRTKTGKNRKVLLNPVALDALIRQKPKSFMAGGRVFLTEDGEGYNGANSQKKQFERALLALGIRRRPQYNTRHTYATFMIMKGVNHKFVADQLGHSVQMLLKHYSKWIEGQESQNELAKLGLSTEICPEICPKPDSEASISSQVIDLKRPEMVGLAGFEPNPKDP